MIRIITYEELFHYQHNILYCVEKIFHMGFRDFQDYKGEINLTKLFK